MMPGEPWAWSSFQFSACQKDLEEGNQAEVIEFVLSFQIKKTVVLHIS